MASPRWIPPEPVNPQEPEIAAALTIRPLRIPESFPGYIREGDLKDLAKRDRKVLLAMSILEQWNDWQTEQLEVARQHSIQSEAEIIRLKMKVSALEKTQTHQGWQWKVLIWLGVAFGAGLISALFRFLFDKMG